MIQNERQYGVTQRKMAALKARLDTMERQPNPDLPEEIRESDLFSIRYLIDELQAEIIEYEKQYYREAVPFRLESVLDDLPAALARARIARGWSERDLAQALGSSEQQVRRDERGGYSKASLARLTQVARTLGLKISGEVRVVE